MDYDNEFISSLLQLTEKEEILNTFRLVPNKYIHGTEQKAYDFIKKYYVKSKGKLPTVKAVKQEFPILSFSEKVDDIHFYVDKLAVRVKYNLLADSFPKMANALSSRNTDIEQVEEMLYSLVRKMGELNLQEATTVKTGLGERKRKYLEAKRNKGKIGYQLGVGRIDKHLGGIKDEMFVIMGKVGVGKTYLALMFVVNIWLEHKIPIVIITNELSTDVVKSRIDAIIGHFSYSKYRKGQLSKKEELTLKNLGKIYDELTDIHVISGAGKSVSEIEYEILAINPALFVVDGLYLTDMGYNDQYKNTMEASRAYQRLIKRHRIPGILTTQMMDGDVTKYARAIQEDADIVLRMEQPDALKLQKVMELGFTKVREEDDKLLAYLHWDFETMDFSEDPDAKNRDEVFEKEFLI
jgi:KaiC/GvpD/RAD55 family RecA-like ATPase